MKKLWIFGCSFSSGYLTVPQEKTYGNLLAEEMGLEIKNMAHPGRSNDMIFYDLLSNINNINNDDYIIFQFTSFDRVGFFLNNNTSSYFSSAGLPQLGIDVKIKEEPFNKFSKEELKTLIKHIIEWGPNRWKFDLDNTINLLNYLQNTKNVNYFLLFMLDNYLINTEKVIKFPTMTNHNNVSLSNFLNENKLTISDEQPHSYGNYDPHPGFIGHEKIKDIIIKKYE